MSVRVLSRVFGNFHEESEVGDRLVLIVLADSASDDGITWLSQEGIAAKSRLSERHVRRCLQALEDRGEIAVRKAQRGRRRINVYRVEAAPLDPDYDRLPFALAEPFLTTGHSVRPLNDDDRTSEAVTTGLDEPFSETLSSIGVKPLVEPPGKDLARARATESATVVDSWQSQAGLIHHRDSYFDGPVRRKIEKAVAKYGAADVVAAIENYRLVLNSPRHYWNHRWTLADFLTRGLDRFVPEAEPELVFLATPVADGRVSAGDLFARAAAREEES